MKQLKINARLTDETRDYLNREYFEYVRNTPMNDKERSAVRDWVKAGHSVYTNDMEACYEGGTPIEYLEVYRLFSDMAEKTEGMSAEEAQRFAFKHMGWDDDDQPKLVTGGPCSIDLPADKEALPFD